MYSSFNALDSVVIKDDFYAQPDDIRKLALSKTYNEPPAGTPRLAVTSVCNEQETMAMGDMLKPYIPQIENNNVVGINVLFRYTLADTQKRFSECRRLFLRRTALPQQTGRLCRWHDHLPAQGHRR